MSFFSNLFRNTKETKYKNSALRDVQCLKILELQDFFRCILNAEKYVAKSDYLLELVRSKEHLP